MKFRLLGPLEIFTEGKPVSITAPKQRAILARLLLSRGQVVASETLLDAVWGEDPPGGGLKTLQFHISKLRDALYPGRGVGEEGVVVTRAPGYAVLLESEDLDVVQFERIAQQARSSIPSDPERASALFREALSMWRGPALAEFRDEPFAAGEIHRLEEKRLIVLEDRIEADLAMGHHSDVVPELEDLTAAHPFRERFWYQLMVALYRCDRQADALRTYQELRRHLGDELGIEPSVTVQALEEQILLQHEALRKPGVTQPPGGRLRGYELHQMLGQGAFGLVWRAAQPAVGRDVAIKVIRPEYANRLDFVRKFEAEARLVASLEHPAIVPIFDFWRDPDGAYLVMRLMDRGGLDRATGKGWEPTRVLRVAEQIGTGLAYAHHRGVVHGDLHPGNVLLDTDENAYLVDFGLAAHLNGDTATPPVGYASPEQRIGGPATAASDVFGLGAVMFRLLTGSDPPEGEIPAVAEIRPDVPTAVDDVVTRATSEGTARFVDVDEFLESIRSAMGKTPTVPSTPPGNPYKGLQAFTEADAPEFYGRDAMIAGLAAVISNHRLVGLVGPSGSGKSSLVRAGLLPAVRDGRIHGADRWLVTDLYPGENPFARLADALLEVTVEKPDNLVERLRDSISGVDVVVATLPPETELLIVIDQFEELFTLCSDQKVQLAFMDLLRSLAIDPNNRTRVLLTLRADFYGRPLEYQPFGSLLGQGLVSITLPSAEELAQAIVGPARGVGVDVEPDLVAQIVDEVAEHSGGLPLMEYALTQLFEERAAGSLTLEAYHRTKGIRGALGSWAERLFEDLDGDGQEAIRQVCLRLTAVDDDGRESRRRVPVPELRQLGIEASAIDRALREYGNARLLTFDRDPNTRTPTVEIAHEALFREWDRLGRWVDSRREDLILQRRFRSAHGDWEQTGRDPGYLLQKGRLQQFDTWSRETDLAIADPEKEFLDFSRDQESRMVAQQRRRRNLISAGLAGLAVVAAGFGVAAMIQGERATEQKLIAEQQAILAGEQAELALEEGARADEQRQVAQEERVRAQAQERIARARAMAAAAVAALETDPELSVLLATEAIRTTADVDGTHLREAEEALHRALSTSRLVAAIPVEMYTRSLTFNPEGDTLYIGGFNISQIAEAPSGQLVEEMPFAAAEVAIAGRNDELLVIADFEGGIKVLDRETLEDLFVLEGHSAWIGSLAVARGGTLLASISHLDGMTFVWDLETREQIASFSCETAECPGEVALSPDGSQVFVGTNGWEVATGNPVADWMMTASWSTGLMEPLDESTVIAVEGSTPRIIDLLSGDVIDELPAHTAEVKDVAVSPDGHLVATAGRDGLINVWELAPGGVRQVLTLAGHQGPVWDVEFSPDGRFLASLGGLQDFSVDFSQGWPKTWEARIWDVSVGGGREWMTVAAQPGGIAFDPTGDQVLAANTDHAALWDARTGEQRAEFSGPSAEAQVSVVAVSPAGDLAVTGGTVPSGEGWVTAWDAVTGKVIHEVVALAPGISPNHVAFSYDGSLLAVAHDQVVKVWNTLTWEGVFVTSESSESVYAAVAFSPDGSLLVTQRRFLDDPGEALPVAIWSLETGEQLSGIAHFPRDDRGAVAFDPHGRVVLTAGLGRPLVSEVYTGQTLVTLSAPASYASAAAFSPDGARIATAEADGTVRLWDIGTGEEQMVLKGHSAEVVAVAFSPDGTRLASVGLDGTLRVWALDRDDLLDLATERVTRSLTDEECRTYIQHGCALGEEPAQVVPLEWEPQDLLGISEQIWEGAAGGGSWMQTSTEGYDGAILALDQRSGRLLVGHDIATDPLGQEFRTDFGIVDPRSGKLEDIAEPEGTWAAAEYHPNTHQIIVYFAEDGGVYGYDLDTDTWTRLTSPKPWSQELGDFGTKSHGPFGDYGQAMAHDVESDLIVLFGGANWGRIEYGNHLGLGETWVYDPTANEWSESDSGTAPRPRVYHAMAYDAQSDRVILFGGSPGFASDEDLYGDTWSYDANTDTWNDMDPSSAPPARENAVMWYDPAADLVFLFGGSRGDGLPWEVFGGEELWGYDYETNTWTLFRVDPNPGYRAWSAAEFDEETGVAMLFGGVWFDADRRSRGEAEDMWTYRHEGGGD